jgi:hypothetical protein
MRASQHLSSAFHCGDVSILTALRSVGQLDALHENACAGLGREALSGRRLRRLATKSGEKRGL